MPKNKKCTITKEQLDFINLSYSLFHYLFTSLSHLSPLKRPTTTEKKNSSFQSSIFENSPSDCSLYTLKCTQNNRSMSLLLSFVRTLTTHRIPLKTQHMFMKQHDTKLDSELTFLKGMLLIKWRVLERESAGEQAKNKCSFSPKAIHN